jgi:hypothetical protein
MRQLSWCPFFGAAAGELGHDWIIALNRRSHEGLSRFLASAPATLSQALLSFGPDAF